MPTQREELFSFTSFCSLIFMSRQYWCSSQHIAKSIHSPSINAIARLTLEKKIKSNCSCHSPAGATGDQPRTWIVAAPSEARRSYYNHFLSKHQPELKKKQKQKHGQRKEVHSRYRHCLLFFMPISAVDRQRIFVFCCTLVQFYNGICAAYKCEHKIWSSA